MGISQSKKTVQWRVDHQPHLFTVLIESLSVFRLITSTYEFHFCLNLFHISLFPVTFVYHLWCTQFCYVMWGGRVLSNFWSYGKGYYKRHWTYWFFFSFQIISMEIWNHYLTEVRKESVLAPSVDHSPFTCPSLLFFLTWWISNWGQDLWSIFRTPRVLCGNSVGIKSSVFLF